MPVILPVLGKSPSLGENCFIAPNATIVGDVTTGKECSFWFNAVVRGDVHFIKLGDRVNVQDGAIIHCTYQKHPTTHWQQCVYWSQRHGAWMHHP